MGMAAAVAGALASRGSRAQGVPTRRVRRIGTLTLRAADPALAAGARSPLARFLDARGWVEGANLVIERQFADFRPERLPALARQLLDNGAEVLLALGNEAALAAARATTSVPVVFEGVTFPLELGLIESFARPGRNVTGVSEFTGREVAEKRIEQLRSVAPQARRMAWLFGGDGRVETVSGGRADVAAPLRAAAAQAGFELRFFNVASAEDIDVGLKAAVDWRAQVLQAGSSFVTLKRQAIADTCLRQRLPCATAALAPIETTGFLMRFGPTVEEFQALRQRAFEMVDRMLRGADPAVTPVELPRQFEFVLNLKTAAAINLSIPRSLRLRADRLVE